VESCPYLSLLYCSFPDHRSARFLIRSGTTVAPTLPAHIPRCFVSFVRAGRTGPSPGQRIARAERGGLAARYTMPLYWCRRWRAIRHAERRPWQWICIPGATHYSPTRRQLRFVTADFKYFTAFWLVSLAVILIFDRIYWSGSHLYNRGERPKLYEASELLVKLRRKNQGRLGWKKVLTTEAAHA